MKNIFIPIIAIFALSFGIANAQDKNQLNFMNEQQSEQLLNQTMALSEPKLVKAQAELLRKHYEALIQSGFNKDEALQIVIAIASQDKR
jgi:predicted NAD/FAD-binding protein